MLVAKMLMVKILDTSKKCGVVSVGLKRRECSRPRLSMYNR